MSSAKLTLSQAIDGFFLDRRLKFTETTVENYRWAFEKFTAHWKDDPALEAITADDVRRFLDDHRKLSNTSRRNIHSVLSSLWTWAIEEGYAEQHIIRHVTAPEPEQRVVVPFSQADVKAMLRACNKSTSYARPGKKECANSRPSAARDRAIIILLVDTGIRATELSDLRIQDLDLGNGRLKVMGKGVKERLVPIGHSAARVLWRYLATRPEAKPIDPVFVADRTAVTPLNRHHLHRLIKRIGDRAGVVNAHPHRFRHTFAVNFLRNHGDVYSLQAILGHTTLKMCKVYLALAQQDTDNAHRRASPADNWRL